MEKTMTLSIVLTLVLFIFFPVLEASDHDPERPIPYLMNEHPSGDDSGWHEVDSRDNPTLLDVFVWCKQFVVEHLNLVREGQQERPETKKN